MGVVKVDGDGDCLFHALAFFDGSDGGALRIDVADFMEAEAVNQVGFEFEWLDEAEKLRENKRGGHTAIIAFSQMMATRVVLHTRLENGAVTVQEASHGSVANSSTAPLHILYNNVDHYDALIEVADASGMEAAWPQPPPPRYVKEKEAETEFPPLPDSGAETQAPKPRRQRFSAARPQKSNKKRRLSMAANAVAVRRKQSVPRSIRSSGAIGDTHRRPRRHPSSETTSSRRCAEYEWPLPLCIHTDSKKISSRTTYAHRTLNMKGTKDLVA